MLSLDIKTLLFFIALANLFTIIFLLIYVRLYQTFFFKLNLYITGKALQFITLVIFIFKLNHLDNLTMMVSVATLMAGIAIESYCLVTANTGFIRKKFIRLSIVAVFAMVIYAFVVNNIIVRVVFTSIFLSFFYAYVWRELSTRKTSTNMQRIAGWLGFIIAILFLGRAVYPLIFHYKIEIYSQVCVNVFTGIGLFLTATVLPLIYLLIQIELDESTIKSNKKEILKKNKQLKKLNATKDKFFSIISHDLLTPYNSILGFLEIMIHESHEKEYSNIEKYSSVVYQSASQSYYLLNNLLQWSKLQTGHITINPEKFQISPLVDNIYKLLQLNFEEKNIVFVKEMGEECVITADKLMMETIIRNLISNAIKFTPNQGTIALRLSHTSTECLFEISDTGIGIKDEDIHKLFKTGTIHTTKGTNKEEGSGLGLMLCKEFVEKHGGRIWVESKPKKGSSFFFTIKQKASH